MKILVLGYGSIGRRHATLLAQTSDVGVVEICQQRRNQAKGDGIASVFEGIGPGLIWRPEAIIIATPTHLHVDSCRAVMDAGLPILVEKPVANTTQGLAFFENLAADEADRITVMANMRFHAGPETLRDYLPKVGNPLSVAAHFGSYLPDMRPGTDYRTVYAAHRKRGGGVLLDCIHELDYLWWLFGKPKLVCSHLSRLSKLEIDVEDHSVTVLDHPKGLRSLIELDYLQRHKLRSCRITGETGSLIWQSRAKAPEIVNVFYYGTDQREPTVLYQNFAYDHNDAYRKYLGAFLTFARSGRHGRLLDLATAICEVKLLLGVIAQSDPDKFSAP